MAGERLVGLAELAGDPGVVRVVKVEAANDMDSLMFHWLDEFLFGFNTEYFVPVRIRVVDFHASKEGRFGITGVAVGGVFDAQRDVCGTEIKAITYSAMQVLDVCTDATVGDAGNRQAAAGG
jgi:SHS2 domain-containing protein